MKFLSQLSVLWGITATLSLCACGGTGTLDNPGRFAQCASVSAADGPGSGSAASHGTPGRDEGAVSVSTQAGQFRASRRVALTNDFGGASQAQVDLSSMNGNVSACVRSGGGYRIHVLLEARAATEAEARAALDSMTVNHNDTLVAGVLRLNTSVESVSNGGPTQSCVGAPPVCVVGNNNETGPSTVQRSASILAGLPAGASYQFNHSTSNGEVSASGFNGSSAQLGTTNGNVALDGRWDSATLDTSNGLVGVSGDYATLSAAASNGSVDADLRTTRSLNATLSSTNGQVDVALQSSGAGFDLQASTTNGRASISVTGTEAIGPQSNTSAHRRSPDYATRAVQVQVNATSTNGDSSIHQ